jgi:hypothetical protein
MEPSSISDLSYFSMDAPVFCARAKLTRQKQLARVVEKTRSAPA